MHTAHHWSNIASVLHHNIVEAMHIDISGIGTQWMTHDKENLLHQRTSSSLYYFGCV